ncbi:hypothetical protein [Dactylosporangium sp. NPDC050588]|uniref:hypothetical protein n=1 Tax=Dactylosporangium sp. NPDC050588 TaxID=3157211 RepID=UPI003404DFD5
MDPSQQWQHPQQGQQPQYPQPGPQYPPQGQQPQYPPQQYPQHTTQFPQQPQQPQQPSYPQQQPQYPNQPYSAQPYNIAPNSAAPYSGPPANPYAAPGPYVTPTPLPAPARSRGNRLVPILAIGGVLVVVLVVAIVVVALNQDKEPAAGPTVAASASQSGPVDACLVGKWNQTSYQKIVDLGGTDIDKREGIGKVKMTGGGKQWTINADGTAVEDDTKTVYSGKDDKGRTIDATFSGKTDWQVKTVGRTIEFAGKESTSSVVISVDGRKAGTINLEPNLDPTNYTCVGDVWRTSSTQDPDSFARYDKVK